MSISYDIFIHPQRDPGCWQEAEQFLRSFIHQYAYAMVLFDYDGSGQESQVPEDLQQELEQRLEINGWENRVRVIILQPELEIWVWSDSPRVAECLGWADRQPDLRTWLHENGLWEKQAVKPENPKLAVELSLREVRKPRSSALYRQLAKSVSLNRCVDGAFDRLRSSLQEWFSM